MVFSSQIFLFYFLPTALILYYLSPKALRSGVLAVLSFVFYGWWRPDYSVLMLISAGIDYYAARRIESAQRVERRGTFWLVVSCVANLGLLGYFKYANLVASTVNDLRSLWGAEPLPWVEVLLPVGISFYTFQTLSYTIDVWRKEVPAARSFVDFLCFVSMFPQLVAGPIVRYSDVAEQLVSREHGFEKFYRGVLFLQAGLAKKVLIADNLHEVAAAAFDAPATDCGHAWLGLVSFALQIYFDFSGYSDMAIGLGLMLGFRFPINFDSPYKSRSVTEFWRRWHMSLSTWLRDYLYISLGGNRLGPLRTYFNLALTMLLGGLWHGAQWTFVLWGAYQGFWLIVERLAGKDGLWRRAPAYVGIGITFLTTLGGWVLFRAPTAGRAVSFYAELLGFGSGENDYHIGRMNQIALAIGLAIAWFAPTSQRLVARAPTWFALLLQPLFVWAVLHLFYEENVPFLYYQF